MGEQESVLDRILGYFNLVKQTTYETSQERLDESLADAKDLRKKRVKDNDHIRLLEKQKIDLESRVTKLSGQKNSLNKDLNAKKGEYDILIELLDSIEQGYLEAKQVLESTNGHATITESFHNVCIPPVYKGKANDKINFPKKEEAGAGVELRKFAVKLATIDYIKEIRYMAMHNHGVSEKISINGDNMIDATIKLKRKCYSLQLITTAKTPVQKLYVAELVSAYMKGSPKVYMGSNGSKVAIC